MIHLCCVNRIFYGCVTSNSEVVRSKRDVCQWGARRKIFMPRLVYPTFIFTLRYTDTSLFINNTAGN